MLKQFDENRLHAVYKLQEDVCHNLWRAQTALIHYTREPAEWLTLKPDTDMLIHLPLGDIIIMIIIIIIIIIIIFIIIIIIIIIIYTIILIALCACVCARVCVKMLIAHRP